MSNHNECILDKQTFTPCTRLSRLSLATSQSIRNKMQIEFAESSLTDKLFQARYEEEIHPNLNMFLNDNKILIQNNTDDEESEDEDMLSSGPCQMSVSPDFFSKRTMFDDDDFKEVEECLDFYDPTHAWLTQIYKNDHTVNMAQQIQNDINVSNQENTPPAFWLDNCTKKKHFDSKRVPLAEIPLEKEQSSITNKKIMLGDGRKIHRVRIMRALSPPRFSSKNKGKETSSS